MAINACSDIDVTQHCIFCLLIIIQTHEVDFVIKDSWRASLYANNLETQIENVKNLHPISINLIIINSALPRPVAE